MSETIYIPTPISQKPEKEGYYFIIESMQEVAGDHGYYSKGEWWQNRLECLREGVTSSLNISDYEAWLQPAKLSDLLAAKDKEIEILRNKLSKTTKAGIDWCNEIRELKLEIEKRDKEIEAIKAKVEGLLSVLRGFVSGYDHSNDAHKYNNEAACIVCFSQKKIDEYSK